MPSILLRDFIRDIVPAKVFQDDPHVFQRPNETDASHPRLYQGMDNGILLYPGTFNPVHRGHVELARFLMSHAGEDINLVAVFIIVQDDDVITEEGRDPDSMGVAFTQKQRGQLWRDGAFQDGPWPALVWSYGESSWRTFRSRLEDKSRVDWYQLKFYVLYEHTDVKVHRIRDPDEWGCTDIITSNVFGDPDFLEPSSGYLLNLAHHTTWNEVAYRGRDLKAVAMRNLRREGHGYPATEAVQEEMQRIHRSLDHVRVSIRRLRPQGSTTRRGPAISRGRGSRQQQRWGRGGGGGGGSGSGGPSPRLVVRFVKSESELRKANVSSEEIGRALLEGRDPEHVTNPEMLRSFFIEMRAAQSEAGFERNWGAKITVDEKLLADTARRAAEDVPDVNVAAVCASAVRFAAAKTPSEVIKEAGPSQEVSYEKVKAWLEKIYELSE